MGCERDVGGLGASRCNCPLNLFQSRGQTPQEAGGGVIRKLVGTFSDLEEKGVMVFHFHAAERRSAGPPAPGLNAQHPDPPPRWASCEEMPGESLHGCCSFLGRPLQTATHGVAHTTERYSLSPGGQTFDGKVSAGHALSGGARGENPFVSSSCWWLWASLGLGQRHPNLRSVFTWPSSRRLCAKFSLLSPERILVTRFRAQMIPS